MLNLPPSPWGYTSAELQEIAAKAARLRITADHMCPACGNPPAPFCLTCQGRGIVTGLQLSIWQRQEDARIAEGTDRG